MSKIQILDKIITNRIAAGEVVERPASVIKELFENSIDAGADKILIEIEEGGTKSISITDNGGGIEFDDVKTAFLPHSTSKIKNLEDLENIATLGFRGEALASIASVSQVEIITKTKNNLVAAKLIVEGGEFGKIEETTFSNGTKIIVKNLFYNTPARRKFLRKNKTEQSEITNLIERLMLANPKISIKYVIDNKTVYNTIGSGMFDNIYTIYGKEIAKNLIPVDFTNGKFSLIGYIGKPEIAKPNRTYQTLMINGRVIQNFLISNAVSSAYENYLMKNRFPFFVLNFLLPYDSVDVNVHPNKQEVKFEKTNLIYSFFANAISEALFKTNYVKVVNDFAPKTKSDKEQEIGKSKLADEKLEIEDLSQLNINSNLKSNATENSASAKPLKSTDFTDILKIRDFKSSFDSTKISPTLDLKSDESNISKIFIKNLKQKNEIERTDKTAVTAFQNIEKDTNQKQSQTQSVMSQIGEKTKIIGTVFNTYIIVEKGNNLYIIDQHAGHERKLYDEFKKEVEKNMLAVQDLLIAYTFRCNSLEYQFFIDNLKKFEKLGFFMEPFGSFNIKLTKIPMLFCDINLKDFIDEIKENIVDFNKKTSDILKEKIAQKACKFAIKAGDKLTLYEIEKFVKDLENDTVLLCPHGRPIVIQLGKNQFEKWFKRIV